MAYVPDLEGLLREAEQHYDMSTTKGFKDAFAWVRWTMVNVPGWENPKLLTVEFVARRMRLSTEEVKRRLSEAGDGLF